VEFLNKKSPKFATFKAELRAEIDVKNSSCVFKDKVLEVKWSKILKICTALKVGKSFNSKDSERSWTRGVVIKFVDVFEIKAELPKLKSAPSLTFNKEDRDRFLWNTELTEWFVIEEEVRLFLKFKKDLSFEKLKLCINEFPKNLPESDFNDDCRSLG